MIFISTRTCTTLVRGEKKEEKRKYQEQRCFDLAREFFVALSRDIINIISGSSFNHITLVN